MAADGQGVRQSPNPDFETIPLIYQGASDDFRGPLADVEFPDDALFIDMEGEFGVVLGEVPMGTPANKAWPCSPPRADQRLVAAGGRSSGNAAQASASCKPSRRRPFAPVAITPDELGPHWSKGRVGIKLHVEINVGR